MQKKYYRKNKKMLSVYLDQNLHHDISQRASFKNITITKWILTAIFDLMQKENQYL